MPYRDLEDKRAQGKRYRLEHKEQFKLSGIKYRKKIRDEAFQAYGGYRCVCCGETEPLFLTLDHIDGNGAAHRRQMKDRYHLSGSSFYLALRNEGYPLGLQVLCFNCNLGRQLNGGICPHVTKR